MYCVWNYVCLKDSLIKEKHITDYNIFRYVTDKFVLHNYVDTWFCIIRICREVFYLSVNIFDVLFYVFPAGTNEHELERSFAWQSSHIVFINDLLFSKHLGQT